MANLSHESKITVALLIVMLGVAFMVGSQIQKLNGVDERLSRMEEKFDRFLEARGLTAKK